MGIPAEEMAVWDFDEPLGGLKEADLRRAKIILWKGFCSVHQMFRPQHIEQFRAKHPDGFVISHPECCEEVCQQSDFVGSTDTIIRTIAAAPKNTRWAGRHRIEFGAAHRRRIQSGGENHPLHVAHGLHVLDHGAD